MQQRTLGSDGLRVSALGLGCMSMSEFYGDVDPQRAERTLLGALDLGVTFFDTAEMYGMGANEELIGRVFAGRFDGLAIATKWGICHKNSSRKSVSPGAEIVSVTAVQPSSGGIAPGTAPTNSAAEVARLSGV